MANAVVSGGIALLLDAKPELTPGQVKVALQMGASFAYDEGLIGGGAGSVNFPSSLKLARTGLVPGLLTTLEGLLGPSGGASFRDTGTMIDRIYDRSGVRLLGLLDVSLLWLQADSAEWGVLNLLGTANPIG